MKCFLNRIKILRFIVFVFGLLFISYGCGSLSSDHTDFELDSAPGKKTGASSRTSDMKFFGSSLDRHLSLVLNNNILIFQ